MLQLLNDFPIYFHLIIAPMSLINGMENRDTVWIFYWEF